MSCHHTLEVVLPLNSIHYQMMVALPLNSIHYQMMVDLPSNPTKKANPFNDQSLVRHMDRLLVLQSSDQTQMSTVGVLSTAGLRCNPSALAESLATRPPQGGEEKATWRWRGGALACMATSGDAGWAVALWSLTFRRRRPPQGGEVVPAAGINSTARLESLHRPTRPPQGGDVLPLL
ncbi:hypothetical protein V6N13_130131 [Hibiscus sabdariffa]